MNRIEILKGFLEENPKDSFSRYALALEYVKLGQHDDAVREFETVKARVAVGRSLENLAGLMKGSITELQGMMGGELSQSMQQLRQSAASGEGQMRATLDLAKEMGSNVQRQQEMRKARGAVLFQEYKKKMGLVQSDAAPAPQASPAQPERQKIAEQ